MSFILSHQILDELLAKRKINTRDLAGIDKLFGGDDGYYWYHTLRHLCPSKEVMIFQSEAQLRKAVQGYEDATAAEDEVKPQQMQDRHIEAIAQHLKVGG